MHASLLTGGLQVDAFERDFAAMVGAKHAVAVCNATAALHLAMRVLGVGAGDRVVTSPNTFLASANAAAFVGAVPDFSDIDDRFHNLDPALLEKTWQADTKAVVAVDYAGQPCNMPEIARIARARGAYVVEDACHGVGGGFRVGGKNWKLGGHSWADITTFSFHPVKTMTTGEGGMLVTDNDEWAVKARLLRSHGVTRDPADFIGLSDSPSSISDLHSSVLAERGPWYYEMQDLGYNYRITDIQCALGRSQLGRLPQFLASRREVAARYSEALADLDWVVLPALSANQACATSPEFSFTLTDLSLHLYTILIDFAALGTTRTKFMQFMAERGVGTQVLYIPVYLQPWYRRTYGYQEGKCPVAERFYSRAISLPMFAGLSDDDQHRVISALRSFI